MYDYLLALSLDEHFFSFRDEVKAQLETQLETLKQQQQYRRQKKQVINCRLLVDFG
ncbi:MULTISPECIES: hypothetical protein [unclassified Nostoc]|uniref:hypothetical protein n=1 Tax=unclassified Nostoc TaxID=2593658 RepID=UPI002618D64D|nr:hypothetical protein [Nostoc sp. S13]MDF5735844.1 hypothetical protein [Nostoc sp. S13]